MSKHHHHWPMHFVRLVFRVDVIGDANDVGYIEGAIHSAGTLARSL